MNFLYVFGIYNFLDPQEYQLALTVFYETDSDYYASTFVNETIDVIDNESIWDIRLYVFSRGFLRYSISIVVMMVVLVVFVYQYFASNKKVAKKTVSKDEFLPKDKKKN